MTLAETTSSSAAPDPGNPTEARLTADVRLTLPVATAPVQTGDAEGQRRSAAASRGVSGRSAGGCDEGSAALELAVAMVATLLGMIVLSVGYQIQTSTDDVAEAAGQAARAASMTASTGQARAAAATTARQRLAAGACRPGTVDVSTDVTDFRAGGAVTVTVACTTQLPLGGPHRSRSTAREIIDRYRGGL